MEEKKTLKDRWNKAKDWFKEHPDVGLTLLGGALALVGGCMKLYVHNHEYEDSIMAISNGDVYEVPAKKVKSIEVTTF